MALVGLWQLGGVLHFVRQSVWVDAEVKGFLEIYEIYRFLPLYR